MKGIQEALGIESSNHMKGLQVFIADIRNCPNKEQEQKRVEKELAKIRLKFTNTKSAISGYDKKKYVWKLLYAYMLGYDVDFGHFQAVELCSSMKFSEKNAGYLAISLLLADNSDILRLVVNSIKNDMNSGNEFVAALALNTVANIGGTEFADNLFTDISKMLLSNTEKYSSYLKRKACICLLRLYRRDTDSLQPEVWRKKVGAMFHDKDIGLLTSVSGFVLAILEQSAFPIAEWKEIVPSVILCLQTFVQGDCLDQYKYYQVPAPWLQTKLLRILQFFPVALFDEDAIQRINAILHQILTKPALQRMAPPPGSTTKKRCKADAERQNRSNAEHAILFESMNLMIQIDSRCDPETIRLAAGLLGSFISSTDANIRYLGLETMARLAINEDTFEHLERYKNLIMEKMHEPDISIRRQALNLLYALCRPENWQQIVDELLEILGPSDALLQEELVLKIAILAEKNAPNFKWYVDVVFRMLESAPEAVGDDVWYRVVQVVTGFDDGQSDAERTNLQEHAAEKAFKSLAGSSHETLVKLCAYLIGEFGHLLPDRVAPQSKFQALSKHYMRAASSTKAILILSFVKLLNANPDELRGEVLGFLEDIQDQQDPELQQRACELLQLVRDEDLLEKVLFMMPQYTEKVQQNNPLIRRLKFQSQSRAATRTQLETAAKSEGGVYRTTSNRVLGADAGDRSPAISPIASTRSIPVDNPSNGARSDSESESGSDSSDGNPPQRGNNGGAAAQGPADLWKNLCIMPQGSYFQSGSLCLDLKQEYNGAQGRMMVLFQNRASAPISNIRVMLPEVPFMRFHQGNEAPSGLKPGEQVVQTIQCQCLAPFLNPAKYLVEYTDDRGQVQRLPLLLPCIMTKFISSQEMQLQLFRQYFESISGSPKEGQAIGQAKVPPAQWANYLSKGFNLYVLSESNESTTMAVGTFITATPDPSTPGKFMTVPCLVKLDYDPGRQQIRIMVRTQHGESTSALQKIIESYLLVPTNGSR